MKKQRGCCAACWKSKGEYRMKRSRWITIGAIVIFMLVTAQLVFYAWKKSTRFHYRDVETPEAKAERLAKDEITKAEVQKMMGKILAERNSGSVPVRSNNELTPDERRDLRLN